MTRETENAELSETEVDYRRSGFTVLRSGLGAAEVAACQDECARLASLDSSPAGAPSGARSQVPGSGRSSPDRLDPVIDLSPLFRALAADPRVVGPASRLLGGEARLFKDKLIAKPPGAAGYLAHQDYAYWHWLPAAPEALLTVMVAIDGAGPENGALEIFPASHHRLLTASGSVGDVDEGAHELPPAELVITRPGDVVVFHSLAPHRSGPNTSTAMRRQLYFSYGLAELGDLYERYYAGRPRFDGPSPD